jgi:hypothetical protein
MGWGGSSDLEVLHYYWIQPKAENLFPNVGWKHTLWANPLMLDHFLIIAFFSFFPNCIRSSFSSSIRLKY